MSDVLSVLKGLACIEEINKIWSILPCARLVGGVVRGLLMDEVVGDIDFATPNSPDEVIFSLEKQRIKVIPTGLSHGTVTAVLNGFSFEITTLRQDKETDGRRAVVTWTDSWQKDAARRDFTINAMSCNQQGVIFDYFAGQEDLRHGRVRFIGNAEQRIAEDALRILRFFRFHARYGQGMIDRIAMEAITKNSYLVKGLSGERIWSELRRILLGPTPERALSWMHEAKILSLILSPTIHYSLTRFARFITLKPPLDPELRLCALIPAIQKEIAKRLKMSRASWDKIVLFQKPFPLNIYSDDLSIRRALADYSADVLVYQSWIAEIDTDPRLKNVVPTGNVAGDVSESDSQSPDLIWKKNKQWDRLRERISSTLRPVFPVMGGDVVAYGVQEGVRIGAILRELRNWWLDAGCPDDRDFCLCQLKRILSVSNKKHEKRDKKCFKATK